MMLLRKKDVFVPLSGVLAQAMREQSNDERVNTLTMSLSPDTSEDAESSEEYYPPGENGRKFFKNSNFARELRFVLPQYWNGVRWCNATSLRVGRKYSKKEFTIISWNIWFGTRYREARMHQLGKIIQEYDPDFIALQEVTPQVLPLITSQKWANMYFISDPEGKLVESYGNIMLSKIQFHECFIKNLESRMGRTAMLGSFLMQNSDQVNFGTFHLESYLTDKTFREKQLTVFKRLTKSCKYTVLVGDTNFTSDSEAASLGGRYKDAWKELYQKSPEEALQNPGLTFDTETNVMAREEYKSRDLPMKRQRLDRCFYTHETMEPLWMKVIGDKPFEGDSEFISDHFGIVVKLRIKEA